MANRSRWRIAWRVGGAALASAAGLTAWIVLTLPDVTHLRTDNPTTTALIERRVREARRLGSRAQPTAHWMPLSAISPNLQRAVLVAEDARFWQHPGYDVREMWEAVKLDLRRLQLARGASTISQQLARNLYLSASKNPIRKVRELLIARRLEAALSKCRILELYLNVVEWGQMVFGAEAAAQTYFHKPAAALDVAQSALLAGSLISPIAFDPAHPSPRLVARELQILGQTTFFPDPRHGEQAPNC